LALAIIAIIFGTLCFPALRIRLGAIDFPEINGSAVLFATGTPSEELSLSVGLDPGLDNSLEVFTVSNSGKDNIHWALLFTGDARLKDIRDFNERPMRGSPTRGLPSRTELIWGIVNSGSAITFSGHSVGKFVNSTSARSAASLPSYGQGSLDNEDPETSSTIVKDLGARPVDRLPDTFSVTVRISLSPFESVTQSTPDQISHSGDTSSPEWQSDSSLSVKYATVDQKAVDETTNLLFVFAVLLGVAGAALLASLQGIIHVFSSSKQKG
jgi:hypothetical protein